jgi:hypothetical protein
MVRSRIQLLVSQAPILADYSHFRWRAAGLNFEKFMQAAVPRVFLCGGIPIRN